MSSGDLGPLIPLDKPPGKFVYVFYTESHMRAARAEGLVTVVLSRPEHLPDSHVVQQISMIEGDSHLAICRPAIDIETPSRSLTLEWQTSAGARAIVIGSANSLGRSAL